MFYISASSFSYAKILTHRFPTGDYRTPGGAEQVFQGKEMRFSRVRLYVPGSSFFQKNRVLRKLANAITQKNINHPNYSSL